MYTIDNTWSFSPNFLLLLTNSTLFPYDIKGKQNCCLQNNYLYLNLITPIYKQYVVIISKFSSIYDYIGNTFYILSHNGE